jgi:hypothetical protein
MYPLKMPSLKNYSTAPRFSCPVLDWIYRTHTFSANKVTEQCRVDLQVCISPRSIPSRQIRLGIQSFRASPAQVDGVMRSQGCCRTSCISASSSGKILQVSSTPDPRNVNSVPAWLSNIYRHADLRRSGCSPEGCVGYRDWPC